jgi:hypothetical protein
VEPQRPQPLKMEEKKTGGRPPNTKIKLILKRIMKEIGVADVNLVRKQFTELTKLSANYHTIKKYLDQLVDDDYLRVQVVQDNVRKIEKGLSQIRRRIFLYTSNENFHTSDNVVN